MAKVVVVGAGPAGIAAAIAAAEAGADVALLDDNPAPGGQIWRASAGKGHIPSAARLLEQLAASGVELKTSTTVVSAAPGELETTSAQGPASVAFDRLILATGARELFLPFPGWTLPGVMGAGGAQALLKGGGRFVGRRVIVSGSGPLLIAVGAAFAKAGADLRGVFEQATIARLAGFGLRAFSPSRAREASAYFSAIGARGYRVGTWISAAHGAGKLETVTLINARRTWEEPCDLLACAYGLVPNTELAELLGCAILAGAVVANDRQETSVANVFAAGEPLGIGGLDLALAEGAVAGAVAAGKDAPGPRQRAAKLRSFRKLLAEAFGLRREVLELATKDTMLCRCEDVRMGEIDPEWDGRAAKLYTRIGMGPCQGRVCGPAARCLFGWEKDHVRPPLYPTGVKDLAAPRGPE